jgi:hypothetical protein
MTAGAALASVETDRLAKLLRLIFGSDQDGEVIAAVAAVKRLFAGARLDAHALADIVERGAQPTALVDHHDDPGREHDDGDDRSAAWFAFHRRQWLTPRDRQFVEGLTKWHGPLSTKQQKWLRDVCDKLAEAA